MPDKLWWLGAAEPSERSTAAAGLVVALGGFEALALAETIVAPTVMLAPVIARRTV